MGFYKRENRLWKWVKRILFLIFILWLLWFLLNIKAENVLLHKKIDNMSKSNQALNNTVSNLQKQVSTVKTQSSKLQTQVANQAKSIKDISTANKEIPLIPEKREEVKTVVVPEIKAPENEISGLAKVGIVVSGIVGAIGKTFRFVPAW